MRRLPTALVILLALSTVGCDQSTKHFAMETLKDSPQVLFSGVELTYTENRDMAFGLLESLLSAEARLWLLSLAKSFALIFGVAFYVARRKISSNLERAAVGLVLAGAAGNLMDRVRHGYVVDFVRLPHWPVFNVADVAIVAGFALLILDLWRRERRSGDSVPPKPSPLRLG